MFKWRPSSGFSLRPELTIPHFLASGLSCYSYTPSEDLKHFLKISQGFQLYLGTWREKYLPQLNSASKPNTL